MTVTYKRLQLSLSIKIDESLKEELYQLNSVKGVINKFKDVYKRQVIQLSYHYKEGITQVHADIGERMERVYNNLNNCLLYTSGVHGPQSGAQNSRGVLSDTTLSLIHI